MHRDARLLSALLLTAALAGSACSTAPVMPTPDATAEAELDAALDALYALELARDPLWASSVGEADHDGDLSDGSVEAAVRYRASFFELADRVAAIGGRALSPTGRDTQRIVAAERLRVEAEAVCHTERWRLDTLRGPHVEIALAGQLGDRSTAADIDALIARLRRAPDALASHLSALRAGVASGHVPTRDNVLRVLGQLDGLLGDPKSTSPHHPSGDPALGARLAELEAVVRDEVRPALTSYRDALRDEVLPAARRMPGVGALPDGEACYRAWIAATVGPSHTVETLTALGLQLAADGHAEWRAIGQQGPATRVEATDAVIEAWRDALNAEATPDSVLADARAARDRGDVASMRVVTRLPSGAVEVHPFDPRLGDDLPLSVYQGAAASKASSWYVNLDGLADGRAHLVEALAFHESLPGHHLQDALAAERDDLHPWRRRLEQTAFVEGWALYSERLADELGLYSDVAARLGMAEMMRWRAVRLLVDTGIHARGWTRQEAIDLLVEHAPLTPAQAAAEVDRQAARPGQALSYAVGWRTIARLRAEAEAALGPCFELRRFHDEVLSRGPIPLSLLEDRVRGWIETTSCDEDGP